MKKILIGMLSFGMLSIFAGSTFANYGSEGGSNGYNKPILVNGFSFNAEVKGNAVYTSWKTTASLYNNETLRYWKVVKSANNSNPVYPDDGYIKYDSSPDFSSFTDYSDAGTYYYRVCAITEKSNRYCSNVKKIVVGTSENTSNETYKEPEKKTDSEIKKPTTENKISEKIKQILEKAVANFEKRLNEKFTSNEEKIKKIDSIIEKLQALTLKTEKSKLSRDYLVQKLEELKEKYNEDMQNMINALESME